MAIIFGSGLLGVYNPFSLLNAFDMNDIRDYWFASGTPTYLINFCGITTSRWMN